MVGDCGLGKSWRWGPRWDGEQEHEGDQGDVIGGSLGMNVTNEEYTRVITSKGEQASQYTNGHRTLT